MRLLIAAVVLLPLLSLAIHSSWNGRNSSGHDKKTMITVSLLSLFDVLVLLTGFLTYCAEPATWIMFCMTVFLIPAVILSSGFFRQNDSPVLVVSAGLMTVIICVSNILCRLEVIGYPDSRAFVFLSAIMIAICMFYLLVRLLYMFVKITEIIRRGNVWSYVWLCSDLVYIVSISLIMLISLLISYSTDSYDGVHIVVADLLMETVLVFLYLRRIRNSPFVLMHRQEKIVLESIKANKCEMLDAVSQDDSGYRVVYERLTDYFDTEKPYLKSDLTINDLVRVIYSNKLYISRAISLCTGRNFRQFVNYYRIKYSCEYYRENPNMKIVELAQVCGFNTVASFNMAFRLFMNETPGEWCRKERVKLAKSIEGK